MQLGPWGHQFTLPVFEGHFEVDEHRWLKETHLKLRLRLGNQQYVDAIAFGAKDKFNYDPANKTVRLVYELDQNQFNGRTTLQLRIAHLQQA